MSQFNPLKLSVIAFERFIDYVDEALIDHLEFSLSNDEVYFIIYMLQCQGNSQYQEFALDLICRITYNFPEMLTQFIDMNLIPAFLRVIKNHFTDNANLANHSTIIQLVQDILVIRPGFRDEIIEHGILDDILIHNNQLIYTSTPLVVRLLPPFTSQPSIHTFSRMLPNLIAMLHMSSDWFTIELLDTIKRLDFNNECFAEFFFESEIMSVVEEFLDHANQRISKLALKTVNKINNTLIFNYELNLFDMFD